MVSTSSQIFISVAFLYLTFSGVSSLFRTVEFDSGQCGRICKQKKYDGLNHTQACRKLYSNVELAKTGKIFSQMNQITGECKSVLIEFENIIDEREILQCHLGDDLYACLSANIKEEGRPDRYVYRYESYKNADNQVIWKRVEQLHLATNKAEPIN